MRSHTVTINGMSVRWEEQGEGIPLILIHGIPTSPALWRHVVPQISGARCLAFEMVGYGESIPEGLNRAIGVGDQASFLGSWLQELEIEKAVFAGHDLGGGVAQIAAVRFPERCAGLFLTNSVCYDSWPIPSVKALRVMAPIIRQLPKILAKQIVRTLMYRGHDNMKQAREALKIHWAPYKQHDGVKALLRQMQALDPQETLAVEEALRNLKVPARIVWGAADQFQKVSWGEKLAEDLNAPLHRIEEGKHFTPEDHPDIVAREINKLLEQAR